MNKYSLPKGLVERFPYIVAQGVFIEDMKAKPGNSFTITGVRLGQEYKDGYTTNCISGMETHFIIDEK